MRLFTLFFIFSISFQSLFGHTSSAKLDFPSINYSGTSSPKNKLTIISSDKLRRKERELAITRINKLVDWSIYDKKIFETINSNLKTTYLAKIGNDVVGYAILSPDRQLLSCLAVNPNYQKKGIGTKLLERIFLQAGKSGLTELFWNYRANRPELDHFYKNFLITHHTSYDLLQIEPYLNGDPKNRVRAFINKN